VLLGEVSYPVFKFIRDWMYSELLVVDEDEPLLFLEMAYRAAKRFELEPLYSIIFHYWLFIIDTHNFGIIYGIATRLGLTELESAVLKSWARNVKVYNMKEEQIRMIFPGGRTAREADELHKKIVEANEGRMCPVLLNSLHGRVFGGVVCPIDKKMKN
jgi:hypothetical protein